MKSSPALLDFVSESLTQDTSVLEPKFAEILKAMASAEIQIKSPSVPLFQRGSVSEEA
jgi:hypothetical protein